MTITIPNKDIESNAAYGKIVNDVAKEYIKPELKRRKLSRFALAGIEIMLNGTHKVYLDEEVQFELELKNRKCAVGETLNVDLTGIKSIKWNNTKLNKEAAKIFVWHFNTDWWILGADFNNRKDLEQKYKVTRTFKVRGAGYMPLAMRKQTKEEFIQLRQTGFREKLPEMWRRHITISQKYRGVMAYASIVICRTAAEQALAQILIKAGKGLEIFRKTKNNRMIKSIKELVTTCKDRQLFRGKHPINKTSEKKLTEIATIANGLVHPKTDLNASVAYQKMAIKCMDNLQYVIKHHLNFIKDTRICSGYKLSGTTSRLR